MHSSLLIFNEFADYEKYWHNRYLMQKIKKTKEDGDDRLRSHDEVWQALGGKYDLQDSLLNNLSELTCQMHHHVVESVRIF